MDAIRFGLLGIGAGAAYALTGQGLVLVYRGSGVINFAQGAIGMVSALMFFVLRDGRQWPTWAAAAVAFGTAAAIGLAVAVCVMRPLAEAPPVVRLISTLAVMSLLLALVQHMSDNGLRPVDPVLPTATVRLTGALVIGADRLVLFGIAVAVTAGLTVVYRVTRFGLATSAVAENARSASALGISPHMVSAVNWAAASCLATAGAILISSLSGQFDPVLLTFLVIPGLAAALVGRFASFPSALAGGIALGVMASEMSRYVHATGWTMAGPFLVIMLALVARGKALPARGESPERAPRPGSGAMRLTILAPLAAGLIAVIWLASPDWIDAITTTALAALVVLSIVVVTGYTGQITLAQYTLAGMSAWTASRLIATHGLPYLLAAGIGVGAAVVIGTVIGLIALRTRGANLAIATLGAALVLEQVILLNPEYTGESVGTHIGSFSMLGVSFDSIAHPQRFATLVVAVVAAAMLAVTNLRRSTAGRRLAAVRANERAAAALGVGVYAAKLYAFALSSAVAGLAGVLMAFRYPDVVFDQFTTQHSITVVLQAVVGGVGFVSGIPVGGVLEPGSVGQTLIGHLAPAGSASFVLALIGGIGALIVLVRSPDGVVSRIGRRASPAAAPVAYESDEPALPAVAKKAQLSVHEAVVRFGGVRAVDGVSLAVGAGEVVGLVGPNGSGKTTLIDAISGFVPAAGSITLNGAAVDHLPPGRRSRAGIGRTFQSLELFPGMSLADNLRIAEDSHRRIDYLAGPVTRRRAALSDVAMAVVRTLGLHHDLERTPDELPYGKRRLVAIARAVVGRPSVLLLDEPAAGLGTEETEELGTLLRRLADEMQLGVLVVEHDIALISEVCDRVVVMARGAVIAEGRPGDVFADDAVQDAYLGRPAERSGATPSPHLRYRPTEGRPVLAARRVDAGYGRMAVVRGLELEVRRGEIVALLGPNGAGKTTSLLTLAGALQPLTGAVEWHGAAIRGPVHRRARRGLALVTAERAVFAGLTTEANLRLGRGTPADALALFPELRPLLRRRAGLLSGGEQQMLSLARALAAKPAVLLVDELSLGLAPAVTERLFTTVRQAADDGVAVVMVEQYLAGALSIADRVCVLNRGAVVYDSARTETGWDTDVIRRSYLETTR